MAEETMQQQPSSESPSLYDLLIDDLYALSFDPDKCQGNRYYGVEPCPACGKTGHLVTVVEFADDPTKLHDRFARICLACHNATTYRVSREAHLRNVMRPLEDLRL
ncbi:MAG: hypothetical protein HY710_05925 [Candidatus Latescibacteria bacterium]|nr:hypothetical protein [Candidatus Latescibacterota bacterium]